MPTFLLVVGFKLSGRRVEWVPLLWAGFAFAVYVALLKSRSAISIPAFLDDVPLIWFGKIVSLSGTIAMLYFLPRVSFHAAGVKWNQTEGSLRPVIITGTITVLAASVTSFVFMFRAPRITYHALRAFRARCS